MTSNTKIEGYWYSEHTPRFPMPEKDELTQEEADKIYELICKKESITEEVHFRGMSLSRIDGSWVGSSEYRNDDWWWPNGFSSHYVKKYRVKPSDEFLDYIGYK